MNLNKLFKKLSFLIMLLTFVSATSFAQVYVSTGGDDAVGDGSSGNPYLTITKGITVAGDGGTVIVEPGVYGETVTIPDNMTIKSEDFGSTGLNTVTINGLVINTTNASDVVSFGETGLKWLIKTTADLTLTKGILNIVSANVTLEDGATITRTAGSINATPTITNNVNVIYNGTADITAGPELPSDLGTGTLTVNIGAANTLTVGSAVTVGGATLTTGDVNFTDLTANGNVAIADGNVDVSGTLKLNDALFQNNGNDAVTLANVVVNLSANLAGTLDNSSTGTVTVSGTLTYNKTDNGAANVTTTLLNDGGGDVTLANGFTTPAKDVSGTNYYVTVTVTNTTGDFTANGAVTANAITNTTGNVVLTGGTGVTYAQTGAGSLELKADFALSGTPITISAGTVKLNANTLTLSNNGGTLTATGDIISTTASTIGSGVLAFTDDFTAASTGELPNVTIASGKSVDFTGAHTIYGNLTNSGTATFTAAQTVKGDVTSSGTLDVNAASTVEGNLTSTGAVDLVGAGITVKGNYTQSTGGTLNFGANTFTIEGNWTRTSNVLGDVTYGTGSLTFTGSGNVSFDPGAQLDLYDVVINKTNATDKVTLSQTVNVRHDVTITKGQLILDDHLRMTVAGGTFTNGSNGYLGGTTSFLIIDHAGTTTLAGTATYSNLDIRGGATAQLSTDINFSGIMNVRNGSLDLNESDLTLTNDVVTVPSIYLYTDNGSITESNAVTNNTVSVGAGVVYDLYYYESTGASLDEEWLASGIRNLTVGDGSNAITIQQPAATTVSGVLTVATGATLDVNNADLTLSGDSQAHVVKGTVLDADAGDDNNLVITGDASSITGSASDSDARTIEHLHVSTAASESFTLSQIESLTDLVVDNGTVSVSLIDDPTNDNDGQFLGDLTLTDGTLTLTIADERDGDDASAEEIAGNTSIVDGKLILGGDLQLVGTLGVGAGAADTGNIELGSNNLTINGVYTHNSAGNITGTGKVIIDYTANGNLVLTEDLSVPNLEVANGAVTTTVTTGDLTVTGDYTQTSGTLDINGRTFTVSGNVLYSAGSLADGAGTGLFKLDGSDVTLGIKANFSVVDLELDVTSLTVSDQDGDATANAYKVIVTDDFTQTAGNVVLVDNISFELQDDFTRTAGSWTMGDGALILNGIGTISQGTGFSVKNLEVTGGAATFADAKPWTITNKLTLATSLDPGDDGATTPAAQLTLADGVTIERQANAAVLDNVGLTDDAIYAGSINLSYTTAGPITTSGEVPTSASVLNDFTADVAVVLARDITVNGTFKVNNTSVTAGAKKVNLAANATAHFIEYAGGTLDKALVPAGAFDLVLEQSAGAITLDDDILASSFNVTTLTVDGAAAADTVNLHANRAVGTLKVVDDGPFDLNGFDLTVTNAQLDAVGGTGLVTASTAGDLILGGADGGALTLGANWSVPANVGIVLNKTNTGDVTTLTGGNLDLATNSVSLTLTKGVFDTDASSTIILEQSNASGQPVQGFTRTNGVVAGNVQKYIDKTQTVDISKVEFPTGDTDGNYRPASFFFKTAPQSSVNLTVNHETVSPMGTNGIPLNTGSLTVTNYPDFFWYVKSDIALAPSYKYDVEFQAQGYTDYQKDGIQNIRLIRRDSGNVANPWVMQGADNAYDNSTINNSWPVVKVIDATGGITTQGSKFTYSQNNKPPVFDAALTNTTIAEGDSVVFTYVASDPDINQTATMSAVTLPEGATFDASTGKFRWVTDNYDAGTHTVTISATDGTDSRDTSVTITVTNVNALPQFVNVPSDTTSVPEGSVYTFTFTASDADTNNTGFTYSLLAPADSVKIVDSTGVLTFNPAFGDERMVVNYTVRVTDGDGGVADTALTFKVVNQNRAPQFATAMADTNVDEAATLTLDFKANASDPDGDPLTFSFTLTKDGSTVADSGAIDASTGIYTWTPKYTQAGVYELVVTATDGVDSAMDTVAVTVNNKNAAPTWVKVLPDTTIFVGDTLNFTYMVDDLDMDAITFMFNGPADARANLDASTGKLTWDPQTENDFISLVKVKATDGIDTIYTEAEVTVKRTTVTVSGTVSYDGMGAIDSAVVVLKQGETVVATDTTDLDGKYIFADIDAGDYTVMVSKDINWPESEVLASDALLAARSAVDTSVHLTDMQELAADVDGNSVVTASDALQILQRVVKLTDKFTVADWLFESKDVKVGTKNVTVDIKGIAAGDVNKSAQPNSYKKETTVSYVQDEMIQISPNAEFEIPVKLDAMEDVSAFTMNFSYPADKMELVGVKSAKQVISNAKDGQLAIAWADLNGKESFEAAGDAIVVLKFKATEAFKRSESANVELESAEVVNKLGKDVNSSVSTNGVEISIPNKFALNNNYPNPFNPTTTISYDLPVQGKVTLTIFNSLGQEVAKLVNGVQEAGSYKQVWNATNVASGVYFFNITVEGTKNFTQTKKMVLLK